MSEGFGALLRRHRLAASLTQEALAERAAVSATAIAALERGRRRAPRLSTLRQIARALDLGPEDLAPGLSLLRGSSPRSPLHRAGHSDDIRSPSPSVPRQTVEDVWISPRSVGYPGTTGAVVVQRVATREWNHLVRGSHRIPPRYGWIQVLPPSSLSAVPSERMIESTARYIAGATRCKQAWDASFRRSHDGDGLSDRDLMEMHGAGLGLIWTTHTTDLQSALALLYQIEACCPGVPGGTDDRRDQAKRVLESRAH